MLMKLIALYVSALVMLIGVGVLLALTDPDLLHSILQSWDDAILGTAAK